MTHCKLLIFAKIWKFCEFRKGFFTNKKKSYSSDLKGGVSMKIVAKKVEKVKATIDLELCPSGAC